MTGFGTQGEEFHAQARLGVQPIADAGIFQLTSVISGQDLSVAYFGQSAHGNGSVFFRVHHIAAVEASLLLAGFRL